MRFYCLLAALLTIGPIFPQDSTRCPKSRDGIGRSAFGSAGTAAIGGRVSAGGGAIRRLPNVPALDYLLYSPNFEMQTLLIEHGASSGFLAAFFHFLNDSGGAAKNHCGWFSRFA